MEWFVFALLVPAFWGMNNVFYKFLMTKKFQSYFSMVSFLVFIDLIFAFIIFLVNPISFNFPYILFAMAIGLIPLLAFWFYSKALMVEEISRIVPLFQFIPIFVVLLSVMFLNEILGVQRYFGITLIVIASMLISYRKSNGGKSLFSTFRFMIPFSIVLAIDSVLNKFLLSYLDYWSLFFWSLMGSFIGVVFLLTFSKPRREFFEMVTNIGKRTFLVTLIGEGIYLLGLICWLIATSLGFVSLVSAFAGLQPFYVFGYMLFLSLFMPKILKEEVSKEVISLKIFSIALMFLGTFLVTV